MDYIKSFSDINGSDVAIAGGKGACLGDMSKANIPVPFGYVILSSAFNSFLNDGDLVEEIDSILETVRYKEICTLEAASKKIRELIMGTEMPAQLVQDIEEYFIELNTTRIAVRSSATAEDGVEHAWAGQLESYLNTTRADLLEKVRCCWASLFSPRAIYYRFAKGLEAIDISVAVVVQKMIDSEASGVAFSVHPVSENKNEIIIEAGYGLGEAIVSGQVSPDSYVVGKHPLEILETRIGNQERGIYAADGGGSEWRSIPSSQISAQVLANNQIIQLAELILRIEAHFGYPCDIEWALENGEFYILQSRPITTLEI